MRNVSEWLEAATRKLTAPAQERIRVEIEDHYVDAIASHLAVGASESQAQASALAELGDAKAAARHFRRRYFTKGEAAILRNFAKEARSIFWLLCGHGIFAGFRLDALHHRQSLHFLGVFPKSSFFVELLTLVALPTACFCMARRVGAKPNMRLLIPMQSASGFRVWLPFIAYSQLQQAPSQSSFFHGFMIFSTVGMLLGNIQSFSIWFKLGKLGGDSGGDLPADTANV